MLGACATVTVDAKKRSSRKSRSQTTRVSRDLSQTYCKMVGRCNVRSGPSESYPVIESLPNGHVVWVAERSGDWYWINSTPYEEETWSTPTYRSGWTHRQNLRYYRPSPYSY